MRTHVAVAIIAVTVVGIGASFLALYHGTGSRLRSQIDAELRSEAARWSRETAHATLSTPAAILAEARNFIATQPLSAQAVIISADAVGGRLVTNDPAFVNRASPAGAPYSPLLNATPGLSTITLPEAGRTRVLSNPIDAAGKAAGTLLLAASLKPVERAQASLWATFRIIGPVALVLALLIGVLLGSVIAAPVRRLAGVASAAQGNDLSVRVGLSGTHGEMRALGGAFNHLIERLERSVTHQRAVSEASRELRTPLAAVRSQAELLDHETDEQVRREGTATLLREVDELDRLVDDMLVLASAQDAQPVEVGTIDVSKFFEDLRHDLPQLGDRDFRVTPADGTLTADAQRLRQALSNLVRNAVARTEPGAAIAVNAHGAADHLEIGVSDEGPGIPPDELGQVFDRFRRLDQRRSDDRGASGLELAIARAIVEAHGGTIAAESPSGGGVTFRIDLPGYRAPR
jgi:signal transduction histidine kinase